MATVLDRIPQGGRVLVVRLRSLGDCVLTTPALQLLHNFRPDLKITVCVEHRFAGVFNENPAVTHLIPPETWPVVQTRPNLCINLHGGGRSARLTAASIARHRAGFQHFVPGWIYNHRIPRAQQILNDERTVHTAEHLASAMFWLGVPKSEIPRACLFAVPSPPRSPYAVIHPMASAAGKTWPPKRFLTVAEHLHNEYGLKPIFLGGPGEDMTAFCDYECLVGAPLETVKALLAGASAFVGNDSGPAHMAAAFGIPVTVLYGTSDPIIWAPWKTEHRIIAANGPLENVGVPEVLAAIDSLMGARA